MRLILFLSSVRGAQQEQWTQTYSSDRLLHSAVCAIPWVPGSAGEQEKHEGEEYFYTLHID